jgi:hypothetical protein
MDTKDTTTIRISYELRAKLKEFAAVKGLKLIDMTERGLSRLLEQHPELLIP